MYPHRAWQLPNKAYRAPCCKAGFEIARTDVEVGMRQVLAALAERMALMYAGNEIRAGVRALCAELSPDRWLAASEDHVARFGQLLSFEVAQSGPWRFGGSS